MYTSPETEEEIRLTGRKLGAGSWMFPVLTIEPEV